MNRILASLRLRLLPVYLRRFCSPSARSDLLTIGNDYGGRVLPSALLNSESVCYCVGVGEDSSFDEALIDRFGCRVHAFDPTPRAISYVDSLLTSQPILRASFVFQPIAVWKSDGHATFYAPDAGDGVSHSLTALHGQKRSFEVRTRTLESLMAENGHKRVDLLKLDIEGAEYAVMEHLLKQSREGGPLPRILCIEFDQPTPRRRTAGLLKALTANGYKLIGNNHLDFTFIHAVV